MAVIKLGPGVNCASLVTYVHAGTLVKNQPQARTCEECGEQHHPRDAQHDGARYLVAGRWLCATCLPK